MKVLFPEIQPYQSFFLETGSSHRIYVEQCGNPAGIPVLFLHGGPCSGCKPQHRRFFDPDNYRIILFDQRACGRSLPFGELQNNTTQDLIADMERIRRQLAIDSWLLFGGSWGAALTLLYAQQYPHRVSGMIIRAPFLARQRDLDWFVRDGAVKIYPEQWHRLIESLPESYCDDVIAGMHAVLCGNDEKASWRAANAWLTWANQVTLGEDYHSTEEKTVDNKKVVQQVRMQMHYANKRYFINENQIIKDCARVRHIPTVIVHGRRDLVCPVEGGFSLHRALPDAEYNVLATAGHVAQGEAMINALVTATEEMSKKNS